MEDQISALFQKEIPTGFALNELQELVNLIQQSHSGSNPQLAQETLLKVQSQNMTFHGLYIFQTLCHFDTISSINKGFNETSFQQLLMYGNVVLQNLNFQQQELTVEVELFVTIIHYIQKWFGVPQIKKHLTTSFSRICLILKKYKQAYDPLIKHTIKIVQNNPYLLQFMAEELFQQFMLHDELFKAIQEMALPLTNEINEMSIQTIKTIVEQIAKLASQRISILTDSSVYLNYIYNVLKNAQDYRVKAIGIKILSTIQQCINDDPELATTTQMYQQVVQETIQFTIKSYFDINNDQNNTISDKVKNQIINLFKDKIYYQTAIMEFIYLTAGETFLYQFYYQHRFELFAYLIIPNLIEEENDTILLHDNPNDYFNHQYQLLGIEEVIETPKGYAISIFQKFAEKIDGFLTFSFNFNLEVIQYLLNKENYVIENSQEFINNHKECVFFNLGDDEKQSLCLFNLCVLRKQISLRSDLRFQNICLNIIRVKLEVFIKENISYYSKSSNIPIKCRMLQVMKLFLPMLGKHLHQIFAKLVKYCFKMLSPSYNSTALKLFAVDTLEELLLNQITEEKMEQAILDSINEFCYYISHTSLENYYNFVLHVIKKCNQVVDMYLDKILQCIVYRIKDCVQIEDGVVKKFDAARIHKEKKKKKKDKVIFMECMNIVDSIVKMRYCIRLTPQLEPSLFEITELFFKQKSTWEYLEELFDTVSEFIGNFQGNTSLTHLIMDNIGKIEKKNITISTIFKLYFNLIVYGSQVLISQPHWLKYILSDIQQMVIDNMNDNEVIIKATIIYQAIYQCLTAQVIEQFPFFINFFSELLQNYINQNNCGLLTNKILSCIYTPIILELKLLILPEIQKIIQQTASLLPQLFLGMQTFFNYKVQFQICCLIITQMHVIFQGVNSSTINEILYQLTRLLINQMVAYMDKTNFQQNLGTTKQESNSRSGRKKKSQKMEVLDIEDNEMKQFQNQLRVYKLENQIEKEINISILPLQQGGMAFECVKRSLDYIKMNSAEIWNKIILEQQQQLQQILTSEFVTLHNDTIYRKVIQAKKRKPQLKKQIEQQ